MGETWLYDKFLAQCSEMQQIVNVKIKFTYVRHTAAEVELQKSGLGKKSWNHEILHVKINFAADFDPTAAEME